MFLCSLLPEVCISKSPSACKSEKHRIIIVQKLHTLLPLNTVLKEGLIMGRNLLRHASLSLYNHFDTHEAQHHDTIFNNRIDIRIV